MERRGQERRDAADDWVEGNGSKARAECERQRRSKDYFRSSVGKHAGRRTILILAGQGRTRAQRTRMAVSGASPDGHGTRTRCRLMSANR